MSAGDENYRGQRDLRPAASGTSAKPTRRSMILLDTDVMIDLLRQYPTAVAWLDSLSIDIQMPNFIIYFILQKGNSYQIKKGFLFLIENQSVKCYNLKKLRGEMWISNLK